MNILSHLIKSRISVTFAVAAAMTVPAFGDVLVQFNFTGTDPAAQLNTALDPFNPGTPIAPSTVGSGVSGSGITAPGLAVALESPFRKASQGHEAGAFPSQITGAPTGLMDSTHPNILYNNHFSWLVQNQHNATPPGGGVGHELQAVLTRNQEYIKFTVTPDTAMSLTSLTLDFWATSGNARSDIAVLSSVGTDFSGEILADQVLGNFVNISPNGTITGDITGDNPELIEYVGISNLVVDLSAGEFQNLTEEVEFRIYFHGAQFGVHNQGIHQWIDNVTVNGVAIPEPGTYAMLTGLFVLVLIGLSRRVQIRGR